MTKYNIYSMEVREDAGWCGSERRYKTVWKRKYIAAVEVRDTHLWPETLQLHRDSKEVKFE